MFLFGTFTGVVTDSLRAKYEATAQKHSGVAVDYITGNQGHCACGRGCRVGKCKNGTI